MSLESTIDDVALEFRLRELEAGQDVLDSKIDTKAAANPNASAAAQVGGTPPKPSGLSLVSNVGSITISWNSVQIQDLLYYEIQVSTDPLFGSGVTTFKQGNTRFTYTEGSADSTYFFRVRAVNLDRNPGPWSALLNGTSGKVGTNDLEVNAASAIATFSKSSGFTLLDVDGESEVYGPLVVDVVDDDSVVEPRIRFEINFSSGWNSSSIYNYLDMELLRRPFGGGVEEAVDSSTVDFKSTIPTDDPLDFSAGLLSTFATFDQPGKGKWEYRLRITIHTSVNALLHFQGIHLLMEFVQKKR